MKLELTPEDIDAIASAFVIKMRGLDDSILDAENEYQGLSEEERRKRKRAKMLAENRQKKAQKAGEGVGQWTK